jgi:glycosyltransferase involved in cell wall biosynthesis
MVSGRRWFRHKARPALPAIPPPGPFAAARARVVADLEPHLVPPAPRTLRAANAPPPGRRVLFINQYYWPDHASTAQHLTDLAESLAERGIECHVLTSQSRYQLGEPRPPAHEVKNGVHVHRVPATSLGRGGTWSRMTDYLSFYAGACARAVLMRRFDVVVTLTTPPIIGLIGVFLKRLKGTRHIYWSMDLHPDASLALGRMSPRKLFPRLMNRLSKFVYNQADRVVALGPYMADRIALKDVPAERIAIIPVWARRDEIYPTPRAANPLRKSLSIGDAFVVMYSGNLGLAHSFDEFLEAARRLRDRADVVFVFVGGGPRFGEVRAAQEREPLDNVRLLDYFPRAQLHTSLSLADVHLISMRPEMTGIVVPGKLYGVMAAGRPAIFVGPEHCEPADTIRAAGCGFSITTGDVDGVCRAITHLAADKSLARQMGERARSAFIASYDSRLCCNEWYELLGQVQRAATLPEPPRRTGATRIGREPDGAAAQGRGTASAYLARASSLTDFSFHR